MGGSCGGGPLQVIFVFFMAIGNMIGYGIMKIWAVPAAHMLELMLFLVQPVLVALVVFWK